MWGKQKFLICCLWITLIGTDKFAIIGFCGILWVVCSVCQTLSDRLSLIHMKCNQSCRCHSHHFLPKKKKPPVGDFCLNSLREHLPCFILVSFWIFSHKDKFCYRAVICFNVSNQPVNHILLYKFTEPISWSFIILKVFMQFLNCLFKLFMFFIMFSRSG